MSTKTFIGPGAYARVIDDVSKKMKKASVNAVNRTAFTARKNAVFNIGRNFTLRNKFTERNVRTTPCPHGVSRFSDIKASTGVLEPAGYMARQETGGAKRSLSGTNLIIPNTRARGGSNANKVRKKYTYQNVIANTVHSNRQGSHKARVVARAFIAAKFHKFIRINDSFFSVSNFRKGKDKVRFKAKQILNLKHESTFTPSKPWLEPASEYAANLMQDFYNEEMDKL